MAAKKTSKASGMSANQKVGIGVGLTAAAVAAAGAYFLAGSPNAKKNRKAVKSWTLKAKAEVLEGLEKAQKITEEEFTQMVDSVAKTYGTVKNASKAELSDFRKEMMANWPLIVKEGKVITDAVIKTVAIGKAAKSAPKKAAKKASAKKAAPKKTAKKAAKKTTKKTA